MISNRKRPRVLSTDGHSSVSNDTATNSTKLSDTPPFSHHHNQQFHQLQQQQEKQQQQQQQQQQQMQILSDTSTDSSNSSFPFYKPLLKSSKIESSMFTNPFLSIHDKNGIQLLDYDNENDEEEEEEEEEEDEISDNILDDDNYAIEDDEEEVDEDDEDEIVDVDEDDDDDIEEIDGFDINNDDDDDDDDDDIIFIEQRQLPKRNSDSLLYDTQALEAYNKFRSNRNNTKNKNKNKKKLPPARIKKQRTNSLPQLPQAKCIYNKLPNYILQGPKLGNIRTNVIPHQLNLPPCVDENGHYIVKPNTLFANRFIIIKLLGQGTFGKVVQCFDKIKNEHVAIKIIRNIQKYRDAAKIELRVLSTLKKFDPENTNHCIHLRECFDYRGHICIVTDLLKISLYDFLENNKYIGFPGSQIQSIAKQLIRTVCFLHDLGIIHTDLKPENVLLKDDNYHKLKITSLTIISAYLSLKNDKRSIKFLKILNLTDIYVIDFGSSIFDSEYHSLVVSTRHYRAPEIIFNCGWSFAIDLWSVGCILVELIIGEPLFKTHNDQEHLHMIQKISGELINQQMVLMCKKQGYKVGEYFDDNCQLIKLEELKFIQSVNQLDRIDKFISKRLGINLDLNLSLEENYNLNRNHHHHHHEYDEFDENKILFYYYFVDLLQSLLKINPQERITAEEAMNHPWFDLGTIDEGIV